VSAERPELVPDGEAGLEPDAETEPWVDELTPRQIVEELDKYIIGQAAAKKAVAIVMRNRWRRQRVAEEMRQEIAPNNLILIGPTGVGKTEISRRLARLAEAPFVKVEASKFTEVGYVGRDVESMIRDLVDIAISLVRSEREEMMQGVAESNVTEQLLNLLLPEPLSPAPTRRTTTPRVFVTNPVGDTEPQGDTDGRRQRTREKMRKLLDEGKLEDREVELEISQAPNIQGMMIPLGGSDPSMDHGMSDMLQDLLPKRTKRRKVTVAEARRLLMQDELDKLVDMDEVVNDALYRVEDTGIVFLDEIDKVAGSRDERGPAVSREGVQRDLLPVVEGCAVTTKYGLVRTDHILFIAAGAFHLSKPSDLIPELQGRFPVRVELRSLSEEDFVRILTEPENALSKQYAALIEADGSEVTFTDGAIEEISRIATRLNERLENIGARRLHTVMTTLLEDVLFELPEGPEGGIAIDREFVRRQLASISEDEDLRRYIL